MKIYSTHKTGDGAMDFYQAQAAEYAKTIYDALNMRSIPREIDAYLYRNFTMAVSQNDSVRDDYLGFATLARAIGFEPTPEVISEYSYNVDSFTHSFHPRTQPIVQTAQQPVSNNPTIKYTTGEADVIKRCQKVSFKFSEAFLPLKYDTLAEMVEYINKLKWAVIESKALPPRQSSKIPVSDIDPMGAVYWRSLIYNTEESIAEGFKDFLIKHDLYATDDEVIEQGIFPLGSVLNSYQNFKKLVVFQPSN